MRYSIILSDPPWTYQDKCHAGKRGAGYKYKSMTDEEILSLPVKDLAADDAVLFLWATWPRLDMLFKVMEAWGFTYKTLGFLWAKQNRFSPTWFLGMGNYSRSNTEPCFIGVRGAGLPRISASVHQLVVAPISRHSEKPSAVRERIVHLYGERPRVELFARQTVPGWDSWGNQAPDSIQFAGIG